MFVTIITTESEFIIVIRMNINTLMTIQPFCNFKMAVFTTRSKCVITKTRNIYTPKTIQPFCNFKWPFSQLCLKA